MNRNQNVIYSDSQVIIKYKTENEGRTFWHAESHTNTEYELHVMLKGTVNFSAENEAGILGPSDGVLIAPGVYHLAGGSSGELSHFTMLFSVLSDDMERKLNQLEPCTFFKANSRVRHLCTEIFEESESDRPYRIRMIQTLLLQLFIELCRQLSVPAEAGGGKETEISDLTRAEIIDSFFEKNHSGGDGGENALAERLHISRRQLARIIKKTYGMDFRSKMVDVRLKHAAMLLRSTDLKVGEISNAVGFSSEGSLYKHFQKHYRMTPLRYRKQAAEKNK